MAKYFRIVEIDASTFERMTGDKLNCLQVTMLADDGNVYVAVDEDGQDYIDVDLEMFDVASTTDVASESWISVKDKLPEPETEVLAVCVRNGYRFICPVIFEDGTMLTQNSIWNWYELENYGTYSEENDDYFIPEGWWENRQFTPDDIYNNPVDCTVTHWMPLPEPPMSARMYGNAERRNT